MLDQLLKLVEQNAQGAIVGNKAIPDQLTNAAIKEVTNQIFNALKGQVTRGNMDQVIAMFTAGNSKTQHPVVSSIIESVTTNLSTKFEFGQDVARDVASRIVPQVMNQVINKTNDPRDIDFDLQHMLRGMTGNSALDISSMVPQAPKTTIGSISQVFSKLFGK